MKLGQHAQGLRALEQSVKMNPLSHDRKIDLAGAYFATGKVKEAERVVNTIVNSDPTDLSLVNIADLYLEQGDIEKAGNYLKKTVNPILETVPVFNNYAVALRRANRFEEAADIYRKCLTINPDSDVLHYNLALLYTKTDKWKDAKEALSNALRLNPDNQYAKDLLQSIPADPKAT
jgi:tetratricopeptide (TPR) repeat protein